MPGCWRRSPGFEAAGARGAEILQCATTPDENVLYFDMLLGSSGEVWLADLGLAGKVRPVVVVSRHDPDAPRVLTLYVSLSTQNPCAY